MDAHPNANREDMAGSTPIKKRRSTVLLSAIAAFAVILAAILIPHLTVSTLAHNEANAMESLHALTKLQRQYAAANPSKGFACDFAQLKTGVHSNGEGIHEGFFDSDSSEGYKFSLTECETDSNGAVVRYKAVAMPLLPGKTGIRAFCTDQTGELLYGLTAQSCRPL